MMNCKKCRGLVVFDAMYKGENFIDLSCIMCGKRWHIKRSNALARWVVNSVGQRSN